MTGKQKDKNGKAAGAEEGAVAGRAKTVVVSQQVISQPPVPGAPHAPTDFQPTEAEEIRKFLKVSEGQVRIADGLVSEISGSKTYAADFGDRAPDPSRLAEIIRLALLWETESRATERWLAYAKEQRIRAWDAAMQQIHELQIEFDHRTSRDADLVDRYPKTGEFLGKRKEYAVQAAETRKANKKAKKPA
jgi:hypothetical protein